MRRTEGPSSPEGKPNAEFSGANFSPRACGARRDASRSPPPANLGLSPGTAGDFASGAAAGGAVSGNADPRRPRRADVLPRRRGNRPGYAPGGKAHDGAEPDAAEVDRFRYEQAAAPGARAQR